MTRAMQDTAAIPINLNGQATSDDGQTLTLPDARDPARDQPGATLEDAATDAQHVETQPAGSSGQPGWQQHQERIESRVQELGEQISAISASLPELATERRVLNEMQEESRKLREQFHERNVLHPMFCSLIGIADRCREEIERMHRLLKGYAQDVHLDVALAMRHLHDARKADLVEIDALLATFGVESYQNLGDAFDPHLQTCIKLVHTATPEHHQRLAQRLLPGYRREDAIIRRECVNVCVFNSPETTYS